MEVWAPLLLGSAVIGVLCGLYVRGRKSLLLGAAVPWFALLAVLLFSEYVLPQDPQGGASMWPVAQLVGGTVAAIVGFISALIARRVRRPSQPPAVP